MKLLIWSGNAFPKSKLRAETEAWEASCKNHRYILHVVKQHRGGLKWLLFFLFRRLLSTWLYSASWQKSYNQRSKLLHSHWVLSQLETSVLAFPKSCVPLASTSAGSHIAVSTFVFPYRGESRRGCWFGRSGIGLKLYLSQMEPDLFSPVSLHSKEVQQLALLHAPFLLLDGGSAVWCLGDTSRDCSMEGGTSEQGTRIKSVSS